MFARICRLIGCFVQLLSCRVCMCIYIAAILHFITYSFYLTFIVRRFSPVPIEPTLFRGPSSRPRSRRELAR